MSFFAVLLALFIEQLRPLPRHNGVHQALVAWTGWTGRNFDAGRDQHAWVVWLITVVVPAVAVFAIHLVAAHVSLLLALAWDVVVLYLTLGFRHFSHFFTDIREALERGDEVQARRLLAEWRHLDVSELPRNELLRQVIEHSLIAAHRHVFGVFFWFVLLSALGLGPAGAVLYRLAEFSSRYWAFRSRTAGVPINERLMQRSQSLFAGIDHVPARLTAFGFAVVGNFEEAVDCWRRDAALWVRGNDGVVLAAAVGIPLAVLFSRYDLPGARLLGGLAALPAVLPPLVGVIAFLFLYGETGFVSLLLMKLLRLQNPPWRLEGAGAILLVHAYSMYVYFYLFVRAGLAALDGAQLEAAASLGAGRWRTVWRVVVPQLRPALMGAALLTFMTSLASFSAPYIFGGGFRVMTTQIVSTRLNGENELAMVETVSPL